MKANVPKTLRDQSCTGARPGVSDSEMSLLLLNPPMAVEDDPPQTGQVQSGMIISIITFVCPCLSLD